MKGFEDEGKFFSPDDLTNDLDFFVGTSESSSVLARSIAVISMWYFKTLDHSKLVSDTFSQVTKSEIQEEDIGYELLFSILPLREQD